MENNREAKSLPFWCPPWDPTSQKNCLVVNGESQGKKLIPFELYDELHMIFVNFRDNFVSQESHNLL